MIPNNYYKASAYDSTKKRDLAPLNRTDMSFSERTLRKKSLESSGYHCQEFLATPLSMISADDLHDFEPQERDAIREQNIHQSFQWETLKNKKALVESIVFVALWFWLFGGIFGGGLTSIPFGFDETWFQLMLIIFVTPFSVWLLGKFALKRGWVKDSNNVVFNRCTGLISYPRDKKIHSLPFDEFDPYVVEIMSPNGINTEILRLIHRYSDNSVACPSAFYKHWELCMAWEDIQRYMDIAQALPDTPTFDFIREHDPVSVAEDAKYNRPKDYWRNLDLETAEKMEVASRAAAKQFPWGKTREQAIESGWQPSGVGEGSWRNTQKTDVA